MNAREKLKQLIDEYGSAERQAGLDDGAARYSAPSKEVAAARAALHKFIAECEIEGP
jgi:hypothetical protein